MLLLPKTAMLAPIVDSIIERINIAHGAGKKPE
jgi:hypothetical protein